MVQGIQLEKLSTSEKLQLMEEIWDDLCRKSEDVPSPDWHREVLDEREKLIREGKAKFSDWEEAQQRIRDAKL